MAYASDTSVIVRLYDSDLSKKEIVEKAFDKIRLNGKELVIFPQVLVEFWAVATRPKDVNGLAMTASEAEKELENLQRLFKFLPDDSRIFKEWQRVVTKYKVSGKTTHDARIAAAMNVHKIESIVTLNSDDFKRFTEFITLTPQQVLAN
ncbi:MAG: PIN domain-containing protein [Pyrinomonadaceae bacterium]|nr:PIN domain-containing protein [Pyrinomonadaceae bacterium]